MYISFQGKRFSKIANIVVVLLITLTVLILSIYFAIALYDHEASGLLFAALALIVSVLILFGFIIYNLMKHAKNELTVEQIRKLAYLDTLTGLENRTAYKEYIEHLNEKLKEKDVKPYLSIIMLDVNGLKKTNDIYGHLAGDELIIGSSECIKRVFSSSGRCFRTGGDEFVVIAYMNHDQFVKKSDELEKTLSNWKGEYINGISISMGKADMAEYPDHNADQLMVEADKLMYKNKQNYYTSQLMVDENDPKSTRKLRFCDEFSLTKYTMPVIRQMAEVIPGGFFIYRENEQRELIYQNTKVLEIYGCRSVDEFQELTDNSFEKMVLPEDFERIQNLIDDQIDSEKGDAMDHVIYRIRRRDGQIRWIDDYGHYSHSPDYGDIYYVFINDITELMIQRSTAN